MSSKHLEDYYGGTSNAETNPKSRDEQVDKSGTIAAILSQPVHDVFVQHDSLLFNSSITKFL